MKDTTGELEELDLVLSIGRIAIAVALIAASIGIGWFLLFEFALKKLPPVQEALGLKKRDKPTRAEMRGEIDDIRRQLEEAARPYGLTVTGFMAPGGTRLRRDQRRR